MKWYHCFSLILLLLVGCCASELYRAHVQYCDSLTVGRVYMVADTTFTNVIYARKLVFKKGTTLVFYPHYRINSWNIYGETTPNMEGVNYLKHPQHETPINWAVRKISLL